MCDVRSKIEKAGFGDVFRTRDGRRALFLRFCGNPVRSAYFYVEHWGEEEVELNGKISVVEENARDIVGLYGVC